MAEAASTMGSYRRRTPVVEVLHYTGGFPLDFLRDDEQVRSALNGDIHIESATRHPVFAAVGYTIVREVDGTLTTYPVPAQFKAEYEQAAKGKGADAGCPGRRKSGSNGSASATRGGFDQVDGVAPETTSLASKDHDTSKEPKTCVFCLRRCATQADWDRNGELNDKEAAAAGLDDLCWEAEDDSCLALLASSTRPTTLREALERLATASLSSDEEGR